MKSVRARYQHAFFFIALVLVVMLAAASCDENGNVLSGSETDSGMDGSDGGPLLGSPGKPALNFTGIGIDSETVIGEINNALDHVVNAQKVEVHKERRDSPHGG